MSPGREESICSLLSDHKSEIGRPDAPGCWNCRKYYTLAYTNIGCLNMDHCLIINDCCLSFVLFCFVLFYV
jgi:hypothetical protein